MTSFGRVPNFANSSLVRCSCMISLLLCVAMASWIGKPNHICDTMSMLGIASLVIPLWDLVESEMAVCLPASLLLRLALWVSIVASFLGLLCEMVVGVDVAKLMASSWDVAAWFGAALNSSFDIDS